MKTQTGASRGVKLAACLVAVVVVLGLGAPWIAPFDPNTQPDSSGAGLRPPGTTLYTVPLSHHRWILADSYERQGDQWVFVSNTPSRDLERRVPVDQVLQDAPFPRRVFLMGTDAFSRDIVSRWLYGARVSLTIALLSVLLASSLGIAVGAFAALGPRVLDVLLMRMVDGLMSFPWLFLLIALAAFVPMGTTTLVLILGCTSWMTTSRLARSEIQSLRQREFVLAARGLGMSEIRIFFRHILPNAWTPLWVAAALQVGYLILAEASLSFLGYGVTPPDASWGNMIATGRQYLSTAWWILTFPALGLIITVVSLHWIADFLRDRFDPRHTQFSAAQKHADR